MYSTICPKCGEKSGRDLKDCPSCGTIKSEIVIKTTIIESINNTLLEKLDFLDHPQLYITVSFRTAALLFTIFAIPEFIRDSEFFWMLVGIFSVYGILKEIARSITRFRFIHKVAKFMLYGFFGAGIGNLISHAGRMIYIKLGYFFNLWFLFDQLTEGNMMIWVGFIAGIGIYLFVNKFYDEFSVKDFSSED